METLASETKVIEGREFRIGRLNVFDSLHVVRLISPLLPSIFGEVLQSVIQLMQSSKEEGSATLEERFGEVVPLLKSLEPFFVNVAYMPRSSFESVVKTCLSVVELRQDKVYSPVMVDGQLMFSNLDMGTIMQLVLAVIQREIRPIIAVCVKQDGNTAE